MSYDSVTVYYFTGTGNSYRVATWIGDAARQHASEVRVTPIERAQPNGEIGVGENSLVGLVMPTHAFTAPWAMTRFALRLPRAASSHAFAVVTRAGTKFGSLFLPGLEGTACYLIALILALKGYQVRGVLGLDMPSNWTAFHPGFSRGDAEAIVGRARPRVEQFAASLLAGEKRYGGFISLALGLALLPVSIGFFVWGRFFIAKLFFASDRCTGCGICAANCPVGGVRMQRLRGERHARPYWTLDCESCMRCMNFCPTQAVEAGHSFAAILYFITTVPFGTWMLDRLTSGVPPLRIANRKWGLVLQYPFMLVSAFLAYFVFSLLLRVPAINRFFTFTTLTSRYRRYREPSTSLEDLRRPR